VCSARSARTAHTAQPLSLSPALAAV